MVKSSFAIRGCWNCQPHTLSSLEPISRDPTTDRVRGAVGDNQGLLPVWDGPLPGLSTCLGMCAPLNLLGSERPCCSVPGQFLDCNRKAKHFETWTRSVPDAMPSSRAFVA